MTLSELYALIRRLNYEKHGTNKDDVLSGTAHKNKIIGNLGDDVLYGFGGDDLIYGGLDQNKYGQWVNDGDDTVYGGSGNDTIYGGSGNDTIFGNNGSDVLHGGVGDDVLNGVEDPDLLRPKLVWHDDHIGPNTPDTLYGGAGDDTFYIDSYDVAFGGAGTDTFNSSFAWHSQIHGGAGADKFDLTLGAQAEVNGDAGNDTIHFDLVTFYHQLAAKNHQYGPVVNGGDGDDVIKNLDHGVHPTLRVIMNGDAGNDYIYGGHGVDTMHGGSGNDRLSGDYGDDYLHGDGGSDDVFGHFGNDTLYGGTGDDEIYGGYGHDIISGGAGRNFLTGGAGHDVFVLEGGGENLVRDFEAGSDKVRIDVERGVSFYDLVYGTYGSNFPRLRIDDGLSGQVLQNEHGETVILNGSRITHSTFDGEVLGSIFLEDVIEVNQNTFEFV